MTRTRSLTSLAGAAAISLTALALAGCGGAGGAAADATVRVARTGVGSVLVDSSGHTLYLFKKDAGRASSCAGPCAGEWPPLRAEGTPTAGAGAKAALVATTNRSDGPAQVTYNGHPVYRYRGDEQPGDTEGQGVMAYGAGWYALAPTGTQVSAAPSMSDGDDGASSSYGGVSRY